MKNWLNTEPAAWTERYESLRRYVVQGRAVLGSQPLGLVVWRAKGMAGWMSQWHQPSQPEFQSPATAGVAAGLSTGPWQEELTLLLAGMTLAHLQPPRGSL